MIVVLSGSIVADGDDYRLGTDTLHRCLAALALYRQAGGCQLVVSGGKGLADPQAPTLARAMQAFLLDHGVQPREIVLEEQSTTTYENAQQSVQLINRLPDSEVFLVTDAAHMLRARMCFEAAGLPVTPHACNRRFTRFEFDLKALLPSVHAALATETACHEWLGLVWYSLRGYI